MVTEIKIILSDLVNLKFDLSCDIGVGLYKSEPKTS